jgi:hypothetical protein
LVSLLAFAQLHHVPETTVLTHVDISMVPAKRGEWTDHKKTVVTLALDAKGRKAFYQLYRELPLAQGLIFGWLSHPEASYSVVQEMVAISGCEVSAQALEKRMTAQAADFLRSLLYACSTACVASDAVTTEILNRF